MGGSWLVGSRAACDSVHYGMFFSHCDKQWLTSPQWVWRADSWPLPSPKLCLFYFCRFLSAALAICTSVAPDDMVCLHKRQVLTVSAWLYWLHLECTIYTNSWCVCVTTTITAPSVFFSLQPCHCCVRVKKRPLSHRISSWVTSRNWLPAMNASL